MLNLRQDWTFADLVSHDEDWVRAEFDAIVAANFGEVSRERPEVPGVRVRPVSSPGARRAGRSTPAADSRQRSPPAAR
ncbi:hypothetical protein [Actinokineospora iranica]|uniref:Uncharacterized protein n=1 Tax=Actinokineospora iranica TaxID=1271860 RepID=A0A1G6XMA4_9PSEU|nr:hypothetical protein [Actinokineospora iranica]SDD79111.1 hypothetical protein SAMN05216174_11820 [Actinokineospora iranica]